jgi:exodeoxyribonuclease III
MAFRKKANSILLHRPDILIIQECESLEKIDFSTFSIQPSDKFWYGRNPHKGVGVFCFSDYRLELKDYHNTEIRTFLPFVITKGEVSFNFYAVWAFNALQSGFKYIGQVWKAINHYQEYLRNTQSIIVGDFNSNSIWDGKKMKYNHSSVVKDLELLGLYSLYHLHYDEVQGHETKPTLFLQRNRNKSYHIDYCFASSHFCENLNSVQIGEYEEWISFSDHMPMIIDFK